MEFNRYSDIENHYQNKFIERIKYKCPEAIDAVYQITEKIDGSNFQISFHNGEVKFGKRSAWLASDEGFFDWQTVVGGELVQEFIAKVSAEIYYLKDDKFDFFFELYGPGVQKRIDYGLKKQLRCFEYRINGEWTPPAILEGLLDALGIPEMHVPVLAHVVGLEAAIAYNSEIPTRLHEDPIGAYSEEHAEMEGVVIKPLHKVLYAGQSRVIIKKKNKKFSEKMGLSTSKKRVPKVVSEEQQEFFTYVNKNRMCGIVSKFGEPEDHKQIGKYISLIANDAFNDFCKDKEWELSDVSKTKRKEFVSYVGALALPLIKEYL